MVAVGSLCGTERTNCHHYLPFKKKIVNNSPVTESTESDRKYNENNFLFLLLLSPTVFYLPSALESEQLEMKIRLFKLA